MKRNLLYNCCAQAHTVEWRGNIERLCRYPGAFNGRRVILLKTGEGLVPANEMRPLFAPLGECEFVEFENDPELREAVGFVEGLAMLESTLPDEITFYAHTKGTSYTGGRAQTLAIRNWRNAMYDHLLRDADLVERALEKSWCVGCFRRGVHLPQIEHWHFAGTFWWVRHDALFTHPYWRVVKQDRYGPENYLGSPFGVDRSFCAYGEDGKFYNLYALTGDFRCLRCSHTFAAQVRDGEQPMKVCPKCFKRQAVWLGEDSRNAGC